MKQDKEAQIERETADFIKCPCDDCTAEHKLIDEWGYFCDLTCGKRSYWIARCRGHQDMLNAGYRKPLDKPELREKISKILWAGIDFQEQIAQLLALLVLPKKDEPPLLSDEEINEAHAQGVYECMPLKKHKGLTPRMAGRKAIAQAQRDKDYKGV